MQFATIWVDHEGIALGKIKKKLLCNLACWRRKWQPIPVFLPEKSYGQRSLASYIVHRVARVRHYWVTKQSHLHVKSKKKKYFFKNWACRYREWIDDCQRQRVFGRKNEWRESKISHRPIMYSVVTVVNNNVLNIWKFLREQRSYSRQKIVTVYGYRC